MSDQHWYDDGNYRDAVHRAERVTRLGWAAIAGVTGLLAAAVIALVAVVLIVAVAIGYAAVSVN